MIKKTPEFLNNHDSVRTKKLLKIVNFIFLRSKHLRSNVDEKEELPYLLYLIQIFVCKGLGPMFQITCT